MNRYVTEISVASTGIESMLLKVARRADELVRLSPSKPGQNLHCWLIAEREILGADIFRPVDVRPAPQARQ